MDDKVWIGKRWTYAGTQDVIFSSILSMSERIIDGEWSKR